MRFRSGWLLLTVSVLVLACASADGNDPSLPAPGPAHQRSATPAPTTSSPTASTVVAACADEAPAAVSAEITTLDFTSSTTIPLPPCSGMRDFDLQVHSRDASEGMQFDPMSAHHGLDCAGHPQTHAISSSAESVFICKNHLMTALSASGYGVIYVTPRAMVDFSEGEALVRWDVSTLRSSDRDWWDVWLTPWADNFALPLDGDLPDLTGAPPNAVHLRLTTENSVCPQVFIDGEPRLPGRFQPGDRCAWWSGYDEALEPSAVQRTTFELRISRHHLAIGIPGADLWWYDAELPLELPFGQAVVQFGHHSYNPAKDGGTPNTWHWDNIALTPAIPFSIAVANPAEVIDTGMVTFAEPAPAGSYLRFAANGGLVEIDDGQGWRAVTPQRPGDGFHRASFFVAVPEGTTSVAVRMSPDASWYRGPFLAGAFAMWSSTAGP